MEREPSVLDYLKARLTPWRGPAPVIPPREAEDETPAEAAAGAAGGAPPALGGEAPAVRPPIREGVVARPDVRQWPWRTGAALGMALIGHAALEPPNPALNMGVAFYVFAVAMAVLAIWRGEWRIAPAPAQAAPGPAWRVRYQPLLISLLLAALAFLSFGSLQFTPVNTLIWVASLATLIWAFWRRDPGAASWIERARAFLERPRWHIRVTPFALAFLAAVALVVFFRAYRLEGVPPEMFSDHAEKLMDISDVLAGQTGVFFPRNTGREAFQMYLTAAVILAFDTGLSFLSLKIGTLIAGLVTLPFIYLLGVEVANRRAGLFAMILAGVAYWPNVITRVSLRFTLYPLFVAPTLYFLVRGLRRGDRNSLMLSGVALGMGLHGYSSFRVVPFVVVVAFGLYLLHHRTQRSLRWSVMGLALLALVSLFVFIPLGRYALSNPDMFSYRAMTRMGSLERPLPGAGWKIFLDNLWDAATMFFWSNGNIWVHSVPLRPALDVVAGALFALGVVGVVFRYARRRDWLDLFLLVSIPLLLLPSVLSLAFPDENPSLNRTAGAIVPVFLIAGLALEGVFRAADRRLGAGWGRGVAVGLAVALLAWTSVLNYNLVFRQYFRQFEMGAWNTSEIGHVIRSYADSIGDRDSAWVVPYPHWVDTRLVGINAGFPEKDYALWPDRIPETVETPGPKLFIVKPENEEALAALETVYPEGSLQQYPSQVDPSKDFLLYFVP